MYLELSFTPRSIVANLLAFYYRRIQMGKFSWFEGAAKATPAPPTAITHTFPHRFGCGQQNFRLFFMMGAFPP